MDASFITFPPHLLDDIYVAAIVVDIAAARTEECLGIVEAAMTAVRPWHFGYDLLVESGGGNVGCDGEAVVLVVLLSRWGVAVVVTYDLK
ncbi:Hypothetical predicted protein [Olea europaea subsp. europaea]|uniref:Uncharacterized protein n=1 Tax=Olea europaea subsp. europaea TaxID=158383 RepID=A0A8S0RW34_OLEEU|nr:Hypothetical predicted protein [Olea europaea subsp. europaea]